MLPVDDGPKQYDSVTLPKKSALSTFTGRKEGNEAGFRVANATNSSIEFAVERTNNGQFSLIPTERQQEYNKTRFTARYCKEKRRIEKFLNYVVAFIYSESN